MNRPPLVRILLLIAFLANMLGPMPVHAQEVYLPKPGVMVHLSPEFNPPVLKGIKVYPDNPLKFDFILDKGDSTLADEDLKDQSSKLLKYFLASLTVPEKDLWVNLSPYEKDRIIPTSFGLTEMGRDLLAEDYILKQVTASLIYPEDEFGKNFWKKVYEEAARRFGNTNIPVNTFNKVWIVPEKAVVYENAKAGTAYVVESRLKVMLEEDYLALDKNHIIASEAKKSSTVGSQIVREIVIPQLTKEVNENKNFAQLRQIYDSLILAAWYKKKIKGSILSKVYNDRNKVAGINTKDPNQKQQIYDRYLEAFKKGVYNFIKEEQDPATQQMVPRKYFSGGFGFTDAQLSKAMTSIESDEFVPGTDTSRQRVMEIYLSPAGADKAATAVAETFEDKRNSERREAYADMMDQMAWAQRVMNITEASHVSREDVNALKSQVDRSDHLAHILNISAEPVVQFLYATHKEIVFQYGDWVVVFSWPGNTIEGLGLRDLNLMVGMPQTDVLVGLIRESLKGLMQQMPPIPLNNKPARKKALNAVRNEVQRIVAKKLAEEPFRSALKKKRIKRGSFRIDLGISQVGEEVRGESIEAARAKVLAVMNAERAAIMDHPDLTGGGNGGIVFSEQAFIEITNRWNSLREALSMRDVFVEEGVLKSDVMDALRNDFKNPALSQDLKDYYILLGLVDFIKQWQIDFTAAYQRSMGVKQTLDQLRRLQFSEGEKKPVVGPLKELLSKTRAIIATDARLPKVDSKAVFLARALREGKAIIGMDKIGMGVSNRRSNGLDMNKIAKANGDMDKINEISMSAADTVTSAFQSEIMQIEDGLRKDGIDFFLFMKGDEVFIALDEINVTPELLLRIRRITGGRVGAVTGMDAVRKSVEKREAVYINKRRDPRATVTLRTEEAPYALNWLAAAEMLFAVDDVVGSLKRLGTEFDIYDVVAIERVVINEQGIKKHVRSFVDSNGTHIQALHGAEKVDPAQFAVPFEKGGIDLTANKTPLEIYNAGEAIKFNIDPTMLQRLQNSGGFMPVIINIHPMMDLKKFLGVKEHYNEDGAGGVAAAAGVAKDANLFLSMAFK